jgi:hypothetical protein
VRHFHPNSKYPQRLNIVAELRREWKSGIVPDRQSFSSPRGRNRTNPQPPPEHWREVAEQFARELSPKRRRDLVRKLGLPLQCIGSVPLIGYDPENQRFTFQECDASGNIVGISWRDFAGNKGAMAGCSRGLVIPTGWRECPDPVFVVEGVSDTLAMTAAGLSCVGRHSNCGGVQLLTTLFRTLPLDTDMRDHKDVRAWLVSLGNKPWEHRGAEVRVYLSRSVRTLDHMGGNS